MTPNLNLVLAAFNTVMAFVMLALLTVFTRDAGATAELTPLARIRRLIYFAVILAFAYRVYTLVHSPIELSVAGLINATVLGGALVAFAAMRVWFPDRRLPISSAHYLERGVHLVHCKDCFYLATSGQCRLVQVAPRANGDCDWILPMAAGLAGQAATSAPPANGLAQDSAPAPVAMH